MIGIYKITSPTGKVYIGQSTKIKIRFYQYRKLQCVGQPALYNSFLKHGVNNHRFEIICECEKEELNGLEIYYVDAYNSHLHGLNTKAGGTRAPLSEESRKKLSRSLIIANKSPITKERRSAWQRGRKMSESCKQKLSLIRTGKPGHPNQIKSATGNNNAGKGMVVAYKDGMAIAKFKSAMEAGRILKCSQQNINKVIHGERSLCIGFFFKRVI